MMSYCKFVERIHSGGFLEAVVYQDISECGAMLWRDESISVQLILRQSTELVRLVFAEPHSDYRIFESLAESVSLVSLINYFRESKAEIIECAMSELSFEVSIDETRLTFSLVG
jgi:hypothetical protein